MREEKIQVPHTLPTETTVLLGSASSGETLSPLLLRLLTEPSV